MGSNGSLIPDIYHLFKIGFPVISDQFIGFPVVENQFIKFQFLR
jgi:hypothetical protein